MCVVGLQEGIVGIEYTFSAVFAADTAVKLYLSEFRMVYIASFEGAAALASVLPVFFVNSQARAPVAVPLPWAAPAIRAPLSP